MSNQDTDVFESTTEEFLNEELLTFEVTKVQVTGQTLNSQTRFRRTLQDSSSLTVEMIIEGKGDSSSDFKNTVDSAFVNKEKKFQEDLAKSSAFFNEEFEHAAATGGGEVIPSPINKPPGEANSKSQTGLILIITGSIVGLLLILTTTFLLVRHRLLLDDDGPELDLLSWSSGSAGSQRREKVFSMADAVPMQGESFQEQSRENFIGNEEIPSHVGGQLSPISENMTVGAVGGDMGRRKPYCCPSPKGGNRQQHELDPSTLTNSSGTGYNISSESALHSLSTRTTRNSRRSVRHMISETMDNANIESSQYMTNAPGILGDLVSMEDEWEGQLDSKVTSVAATPRQNNLEKFKRKPKNKCNFGPDNCDTDMGPYLCTQQSV